MMKTTMKRLAPARLGRLGTSGLFIAGLLAPVPLNAMQSGDAEQSEDRVARLQSKLESGSEALAFDSVTGWLPSVLAALDVPVSSQTLVFSRTSLQTDHIGPWAPRALYFNDDVYVGFVQEGGIIELAAVEPSGAAAFYSLSQDGTSPPHIQRETTTCLMCHESRSLTGGVPGFLMRSVLTDRLGYPIGEIHEGVTSGRTPFEQRWGGWYVTGSPGVSHAGNAHAPDLRSDVGDVRSYVRDFDFASAREATVVGRRFNPAPYLSPHSDAVALSVLAHQVQVHNLIALARQTAETAMRESGFFSAAAMQEATLNDLHGAARTRLTSVVNRLVDGLLFVGVQPLPAPLRGASAFTEEFQVRGPRDTSGRSLRDLDLETRTFRYPLSFLIYSEAFDALPTVVKEPLYGRLGDILSGSVDGPEYEHLGPETRRTLLEILSETMIDFEESLR